MDLIRLLVLADTHLGLDRPANPRIQRRRRGDDFFLNFRRALQTAMKGHVDAVIHGGDVFFRSRVPTRTVDSAFSLLKDVADRGVPVYIVPGNHERSRIPSPILSLHPGIHIFNAPRTFELVKNGRRLVLAGFPYHQEDIRREFPAVLESTGWRRTRSRSGALLLCVHHCFEGAKVGPGDFTFRSAPDVIRHRDVPPAFDAVVSGHIHRRQVLTHDLTGRPLKTPVLYPGSIERTSFAERAETKGTLLLTLGSPGPRRRRTWGVRFLDLPTRPMVRLRLSGDVKDAEDLRKRLECGLSALNPDSVVCLMVPGTVAAKAYPWLRAEALRRSLPPRMNITVRIDRLPVTHRKTRFSRDR